MKPMAATLGIALLFALFGACFAGSFVISNDQFVQDGKQVTLRAANIHYFRIPPAYWQDRLQRLKAMGCNAIEMYIPWNFHNPVQNQYNFEGPADVLQFIKLAHDLDLLILLRPGPYICGEWEFGGFPGWLLSLTPAVTLRTYETGYMKQVISWWNVLLPKIRPYLYSNGGPIVMVQVENEYGFYGNVEGNANDKLYMEALVNNARANLGSDVILYTTDPPYVLAQGSLRGDSVYSVVDFSDSTDPAQAFAAQKQFNSPGNSPKLCSEYYSGWLTFWGQGMANTSSQYFAARLDGLLSQNASVSIYMGHGGTNFGFWNGANTGSSASAYEPLITSYDYDAPVSEDGDHGYGSDGKDKFEAVKAVLAKYSKTPLPAEPAFIAKQAYGAVQLSRAAPLFNNLDALCPDRPTSDSPLPMEMYGQQYGFILYSSSLPSTQKADANTLAIEDVHDRAHVFVNKNLAGIVYRPQSNSLSIPNGQTLDVLVENMGRINFGHNMQTDHKGITRAVSLNGTPITGNKRWSVCNLPLEPKQVSALNYGSPAQNHKQPTFFRGYVSVTTPKDTFLSTVGWTKGVAWVNGNNLGRYWSIGPQKALYVPASFLKSGSNEVIVLELDNPSSDFTVNFTNKPNL